MSTIEQGKNTSFQWDSDNMRVIEKYDLENSSPSSVINRGVEKIDQVKRLKRKYEEFDNGNITLGELLNYLQNL